MAVKINSPRGEGVEREEAEGPPTSFHAISGDGVDAITTIDRLKQKKKKEKEKERTTRTNRRLQS